MRAGFEWKSQTTRSRKVYGAAWRDADNLIHFHDFQWKTRHSQRLDSETRNARGSDYVWGRPRNHEPSFGHRLERRGRIPLGRDRRKALHLGSAGEFPHLSVQRSFRLSAFSLGNKDFLNPT